MQTTIKSIINTLLKDGYSQAAFMLEKLSKEYLEICDNTTCSGDYSVGIPACPFYHFPDIDENGISILGGCELCDLKRGFENET